MYSNCIFCSAALGTNESIEVFPVGQRVAFDAALGRLWVVCPVCGRWNLTPIEERWEAVEAAEKLFRAATLRVQSENIGLARLPDGTRLVRVGDAVGRELAAWRYGGQLLKRRRTYMVMSVGGAVLVYGAYSGLTALGAGGGIMWMSYLALKRRVDQQVVHRMSAGYGDRVIRRWHVPWMNLESGMDGGLMLAVRGAEQERPARGGWRARRDTKDITLVTGPDAGAVLRRAMVFVNSKGASTRSLEAANTVLGDAGSAEDLLRAAARDRAALGDKFGNEYTHLSGATSLAVEMALNEESERVALEGELSALAAAWREAEEIAAIADALPFEAPIRRWLAK